MKLNQLIEQEPQKEPPKRSGRGVGGGAPLGNNNGGKGREWFAAVSWALREYESNSVKRGLALRHIALRLVEDALEGKPEAWREISERLDGKVSAGAGDGVVLHVLVRRDCGVPELVAPPIDAESALVGPAAIDRSEP